jgi:hypothetical protein
MCAFNAAPYVRDSVSSILSQTLVSFELVIVDDGSSDDTLSILRSYSDSRVRLVEAPHAGLTAALNLGMAQCRGAFIARMDADDIAFPSRLEMQLRHFATHPGVDILCTDAKIIDGRGRVVGEHAMGRCDNANVLDGLLSRRNVKPIVHPSVMMRRKVLENLGGYRDFAFAEDHDLWLRANPLFTFAHICRPLLFYRIHPGGVSRSKRTTQAGSSVMSALCHYVRQATGVDLFDARKDLFARFSNMARARLESDVLIGESAFRAARLRMLTESRMLGAVDIAKVLARHGFAALPGQARRRAGRLAEELARRACAEVAAASGAMAARAKPRVGLSVGQDRTL